MSVKSCVRHCNEYSEYFDIAVGLRQGEIISPILFSLFVEDLELYLQTDPASGLNIQDLCVILLLFADDMVILAESLNDLPKSLDNLCLYCDEWGLEVNTDKTKIMDFRNRGILKNNESWTYKNIAIEAANDFNYLGCTFNYTGSFTLNNQTLYGKGLKAMNVLISNLKRYNTSPRVALQLFDAFVSPILYYSCEVSGFSRADILEKLHLRFCKSVLGVRQSTCNAAVYGELGRYPLYINRYVRIVKYFFNLIRNENIILSTITNDAICKNNLGPSSWFLNVKNLLSIHGFAYVWDDPTAVNPKHFIPVFKQRLVDEFLQKWYEDIEKGRTFDSLYKHIKTHFTFENYLNTVMSRELRVSLTKFRVSVHGLKIDSGRFAGQDTQRSSRLCVYCNSGELEDEFHFALVCPLYLDIRNLYIKKTYFKRPSMMKFVSLLNTNSHRELINLCKYLSIALKRRKATSID